MLWCSRCLMLLCSMCSIIQRWGRSADSWRDSLSLFLEGRHNVRCSPISGYGALLRRGLECSFHHQQSSTDHRPDYLSQSRRSGHLWVLDYQWWPSCHPTGLCSSGLQNTSPSTTLSNNQVMWWRFMSHPPGWHDSQATHSSTITDTLHIRVPAAVSANW